MFVRTISESPPIELSNGYSNVALSITSTELSPSWTRVKALPEKHLNSHSGSPHQDRHISSGSTVEPQQVSILCRSTNRGVDWCKPHPAVTTQCCPPFSRSYGYREFWPFRCSSKAVVQRTVIAPCSSAPFLTALQKSSPIPQTAPHYLLWFPIFPGFSQDPPKQKAAILNWIRLSQSESSTSRIGHLNPDWLLQRAVNEHVKCCPLIGWLQRRMSWPVDKFGPDQMELKKTAGCVQQNFFTNSDWNNLFLCTLSLKCLVELTLPTPECCFSCFC